MSIPEISIANNPVGYGTGSIRLVTPNRALACHQMYPLIDGDNFYVFSLTYYATSNLPYLWIFRGDKAGNWCIYYCPFDTKYIKNWPSGGPPNNSNPITTAKRIGNQIYIVATIGTGAASYCAVVTWEPPTAIISNKYIYTEAILQFYDRPCGQDVSSIVVFDDTIIMVGYAAFSEAANEYIRILKCENGGVTTIAQGFTQNIPNGVNVGFYESLKNVLIPLGAINGVKFDAGYIMRPNFCIFSSAAEWYSSFRNVNYGGFNFGLQQFNGLECGAPLTPNNTRITAENVFHVNGQNVSSLVQTTNYLVGCIEGEIPFAMMGGNNNNGGSGIWNIVTPDFVLCDFHKSLMVAACGLFRDGTICFLGNHISNNSDTYFVTSIPTSYVDLIYNTASIKNVGYNLINNARPISTVFGKFKS